MNRISIYFTSLIFIVSCGGGSGGGSTSPSSPPTLPNPSINSFSSSAIDSVKISSSGMNADIHASAEYRANMVRIFAKKAVDAC